MSSPPVAPPSPAERYASSTLGWFRGVPPSSIGLAPLLAAACLAAVSLVGLLRGLLLPHPATAWDAGAMAEAWRAAHGLPVYESLESGHATAMYGPLFPYMLAPLVRTSGNSPVAARLISLVPAIAIIAILLVASKRLEPRRGWEGFVLAAMMLAIDGVTRHYFVVVRPDCLELVIALAALVVMYRGVERRHTPLYVAGVLLLSIAFLVKQSAAFLALIPSVAVLVEPGWPWRRRSTWAALPPLSMVSIVVALRAFAPSAYFYAIVEPGQYMIERDRAYREATAFLSSLVLFWPLAILSIAHFADRWRVRHWRWACCALLITIPSSALVNGKYGGRSNAWLPAYFAVTFFCALALPLLSERLSASKTRLGAQIGGLLVAALVLLTFAEVPLNSIGRWADISGYRSMLDLVRRLPPGAAVASPQDPTIAIGNERPPAARTLAFELDARPLDGRWPSTLPPVVTRELARHDYVVSIDSWWPQLPATVVDSLGFVIVARRGSYVLWRRRQTASTDLPRP